MEQYRRMLSGTQLSIVSAEPGDLDGVARTIAPSVRVSGCDDLAAVLHGLLACSDGAPVRPRTLDLFGHSTARDGLLRLGDWMIDAAEPAVAAWFHALADAELLPRLGIHALRLLACRTAATERGRATICALADILGIEVHGTRHLLYDAHHDAHGFRPEWAFLLVGSRGLARNSATLTAARVPRTPERAARQMRTPGPHTRDVDAVAVPGLGPLALDGDALSAPVPGPRTHDVDALSAPVPGLRTHDVHALPARVLGPRTHDLDALTAPVLGLRTLDVDRLPAMALGPLPPWPRRFASHGDARRIVALIERDAGAPLGTSVMPCCEVALPTACPGVFHRAELLYGGEFLRFYPEGADAPGVAFPVIDAAALLRIVDALPSADPVEAGDRAAVSG